MHHHGVGVPRNAFLAERYYDLTLQLEPGALPAVALSLTWLGVQSLGAHLYRMTTPEYDGIDWGMGHEWRANWDTLLIAFSAILLLVVIGLRRFCAD